MPAVDQRKQRQTSGGDFQYEETRDQRKGWQNVREFIENHEPELLKDDTFRLKGRIKKIILDEKDGVANYFYKEVTRDGKTKEQAYVKVVAQITDPAVVVRGAPLELPPKDVGANFYDGYGRDGKRGTARGGMYWVHLGVTHQEPPKELVDGGGTWETEDYEDKDVLLVITYAGDTTDDRYADRRDGLALWLGGKEGICARDPEASHITRTKRPRRQEQEEEEPEETPRPARGGNGPTSGRSTTTSRRGAGAAGASEDDDEPPFSTAGDDERPASTGRVASGRRATSTEDDEPPAPTRGRKPAANAGAGAGDSATAASTATASANDPANQRATERQVKFIFAIAREADLDEQELRAWVQELYGTSEPGQLTRRDASSLIEALQRRRNEVA